MKQENKKTEINATGEKLGRLASRIAVILMGKDSSAWKRNETAERTIVVKNASKISVTEKKRQQKVYTRYSGYPGGLKMTSMSALIAKKGMKEALRKAVMKMLPGNKLRSARMKNLIIEE